MRETGDNGFSVPVNMGWVLRQDNDPDGARSSFQEALRISRRTRDRSGMAYASLGLACLAADDGDWHGQVCSTAPHRPSSAQSDNRGRSLKRATAKTPWPRCAPTWTKNSSSRPTPRAWHSAPMRPSTWPRVNPSRLTFPPDISASYALLSSLIDDEPTPNQNGGDARQARVCDRLRTVSGSTG